ncbi:MAG: phage tail tape measure protein, partial [Nitrososphaera sp.]|nr:phage tail tape measure protein [Nitrososphaera sp.]
MANNQERILLSVELTQQQLKRDAQDVLRTARALDRAFASISPRGMSAVERELRRSKNSVDSLSKSVKETSTSLNNLGKAAQLTARRFIVYNIIAGFFFRLSGAVRDGVNAFIAFDTQLNKAKQILNPLNTDFKQFVASIFELGDAFGVSIGDIQKAQEIFIRQGKSQAETIELTRQSLALATATAIGYEDATEAITAAVATFAKEQLTALQVADKFSKVSVQFAVEAKDLDDAVRRAGAAAATVGVEFDNLIGFVTAAQEATRRGGDVIGTALRTIFTRIFRAPSIEALQELGIETRKTSGEFRDADNLLTDLAKKFENLTDTQKISIASTIAGQRQITTFLAVLENFGQAQKAATTALNSQGEAARLVRIRQQSLEAQLQKVINQFVKFGVAIGNIVSDDILDFLRVFGDTFGAIADSVGGTGATVFASFIGTLGKFGLVLAAQEVGLGRFVQSIKKSREEARDAKNAITELRKAQTATGQRQSRVAQFVSQGQQGELVSARVFQQQKAQAEVESVITERKELQTQLDREQIDLGNAQLRVDLNQKANLEALNQLADTRAKLAKANTKQEELTNAVLEKQKKVATNDTGLKNLRQQRKTILKDIDAASSRLQAILGSEGAGPRATSEQGLKLQRDRVKIAEQLRETQKDIARISSQIQVSDEARRKGETAGVLSEKERANLVQKLEKERGKAARAIRDLRKDA